MTTTEANRTQRRIVDVAVAQHELLVHCQEATRTVGRVCAEAQVEERLVMESLEALRSSSSEAMTEAGATWRTEKNLLNEAGLQHQRLLALLEVPSLLDDCLRDDLLHEAILILEHVGRSLKPQAEVGLFGRLQASVSAVLARRMEQTILPRLSAPLTVDGAYKIITFLRRLGVPGERLRFVFLQRRSAYIEALMMEGEASHVAYMGLLKIMSAYKVHVVETVMQYQACFPAAAEDDGTTTKASSSGWDADLQVWCHHHAASFVERFSACLERITNAAELGFVVEQCVGASTTTTKVHMDATPILRELLLRKVLQLFEGQIERATSAYQTSLRTFSWQVPTKSGAAYPGATRTTTTTSAADGDGAAGADLLPPTKLMQWLPLAYALNGVLTALNTIRRCIMDGLEVPCCEMMLALVRLIADDLCCDVALLHSMEAVDREVHSAFVQAFVSDFCPHLLRCVGTLLGSGAERWLEQHCRDHLAPLHAGEAALVAPTPPPVKPAALPQVAAAPIGAQPPPAPPQAVPPSSTVPHTSPAASAPPATLQPKAAAPYAMQQPTNAPMHAVVQPTATAQTAALSPAPAAPRSVPLPASAAPTYQA